MRCTAPTQPAPTPPWNPNSLCGAFLTGTKNRGRPRSRLMTSPITWHTDGPPNHRRYRLTLRHLVTVQITPS